MTHPDALLADLVAGSLREEDRAAVEMHLASCERCRREVGLAGEARKILRSLPEVPAPRSFAIPARRRTPSRRYGWLGAAAAAAVVALILVSLPRSGSNPAGTTRANLSTGGAAGIAPPRPETPLTLTIEKTNYDQAAVAELGDAAVHPTASAGIAPSTSPEVGAGTTARLGTAAQLRSALACVGKAVPSDIGTPFKLLQARFNGRLSLFAFYHSGSVGGQPPTSLVIWIVDSHTCTASGINSTRG